MQTLDLREIRTDEITIHFQAEGSAINAYALATALVAFADAAKAANAAVNPGFEVEILVEATRAGSFRAKLRAVFTSARNLWSSRSAKADRKDVVIGLIVTYIGLQLWPQEKVTVIINTDEVIIQQENERIIVPRKTYDAAVEASKSPRVRSSVDHFVRSAVIDERVSGFTFVRDLGSPASDIVFRRDDVLRVAAVVPEGPKERVVRENCELDIVRAILEPGDRLWESIWRGMRISAPVTDPTFFDRFRSHEITVAPGDRLIGTLEIRQVLDPRHGVFVNESYSVVEVNAHRSGDKQLRLD